MPGRCTQASGKPGDETGTATQPRPRAASVERAVKAARAAVAPSDPVSETVAMDRASAALNRASESASTSGGGGRRHWVGGRSPPPALLHCARLARQRHATEFLLGSDETGFKGQNQKNKKRGVEGQNRPSQNTTLSLLTAPAPSAASTSPAPCCAGSRSRSSPWHRLLAPTPRAAAQTRPPRRPRAPQLSASAPAGSAP